MRIISGQYKGKNLDFISNTTTRPTANVVREGLFSKIQFDLPNCTFLDLFAGSGSIGIEAISRGAKEVFFVEKDRKNFEIIKKNLINVGGGIVPSQATVINNDFMVAIKKLENHFFDFVYIDPPYKSNLYTQAINALCEHNLITNESIIICEHDKTTQLSFDGFENITDKKYGIKILSYFKLND